MRMVGNGPEDAIGLCTFNYASDECSTDLITALLKLARRGALEVLSGRGCEGGSEDSNKGAGA